MQDFHFCAMKTILFYYIGKWFSLMNQFKYFSYKTMIELKKNKRVNVDNATPNKVPTSPIP
jgi:hypothetical protein